MQHLFDKLYSSLYMYMTCLVPFPFIFKKKRAERKENKDKDFEKIPYLLQWWIFRCQNFTYSFFFPLKTLIIIKVYTVFSTTENVLDLNIKIGIWLLANVGFLTLQNGYLLKKYSWSSSTMNMKTYNKWHIHMDKVHISVCHSGEQWQTMAVEGVIHTCATRNFRYFRSKNVTSFLYKLYKCKSEWIHYY